MSIGRQLDVIKRLCGYLIKSVIAGFALLVFSYALPNQPIRDNVAASMSMFVDDNPYPQWGNGLTATNTDMWTDAIMLEEAAAEGNKWSIVQKALLNPWFDYKTDELLPQEILNEYVEQNTDMSEYISDYARYWHGYLIFLRPLLSVLTVGHIRVLNYTFQLGLLICLFMLIEKKLGVLFAIPLFVSWTVVNLISSSLSFQYSSIAYITLIATIMLLNKKDELIKNPPGEKGIVDLFFMIGIAIAYFDFLTYPVVALGIPLCYWIAIKKPAFRDGLRDIIVLSFVWILGYALMWIMKWVLASVVTGYPILESGIMRVKYRLFSIEESGSVSAIKALYMNLRLLGYKAFLIIILGTVLFYVILIRKYRYQICLSGTSLLYILVAIIPLLWIAVVKNHSVVHAYMVHKVFAVTVCAVLCMISSSLRIQKDII